MDTATALRLKKSRHRIYTTDELEALFCSSVPCKECQKIGGLDRIGFAVRDCAASVCISPRLYVGGGIRVRSVEQSLEKSCGIPNITLMGTSSCCHSIHLYEQTISAFASTTERRSCHLMKMSGALYRTCGPTPTFARYPSLSYRPQAPPSPLAFETLSVSRRCNRQNRRHRASPLPGSTNRSTRSAPMARSTKGEACDADVLLDAYQACDGLHETVHIADGFRTS